MLPFELSAMDEKFALFSSNAVPMPIFLRVLTSELLYSHLNFGICVLTWVFFLEFSAPRNPFPVSEAI